MDWKLGLPDSIEHGTGDGIFRRTPAPNDKLKSRVVTLAFRDREFHKLSYKILIQTFRKPHSMAKHRNAFFDPDRKMPHPQALVQLGEQLIDVTHQTGLYAHIESTGKMQRAKIFGPREKHSVVTPVPGSFYSHLGFTTPVVGPFPSGNNILDQIDGIDCPRGRAAERT